VSAPQAHLRWAKGGEARVVAIAADAIVLRSTAPSPPGSRIEGRLEGEPPAAVRIKVHASKRQPEGDFVLQGRLLDATREVRARLAAAASPEGDRWETGSGGDDKGGS
jgi:hypothetical protein